MTALAVTSTLQDAYEASSSPQIIVDSTGSALTIRDNATPIGEVFSVQDSAGDSIFSVQSDGDIGIGTDSPASKLDIHTGSLSSGITIRGTTLGVHIGDIFVGAFGNLVLSSLNSLGSLPFIEVSPKNSQFGFVIREGAGLGTQYSNLYVTPAFASFPASLSITVQAAQGFNALVVTSLNKVSVGSLNVAATAKFYVKQGSTSAAIPVVDLEQLDIDDTFINYIGTSASDGSRSISSDTTEDSAKFGAFRVEINGVTKWVRVYDNES